MTKDQLARLGSTRDTFNLADRSLDRALLHVPQVISRMRAAARFGYASTARVEETLAAVASASTKLQQARADFDAAKHVVVGFGEVKLWRRLEKSYGDVEPIPCPQKRGSLEQDEVAFGDNEIPGFWDCPWEGKVAAMPEEVMAAARGIKREINLAEGMIDRAFRCTTKAIASAVEERRELRLPPTFGQEVLDHLIAAQAMLSD